VTHDHRDRIRMKVPHCVYQCESVAGRRNVKITNQGGELLGDEKNYSLFNVGRRNYFEAAPFEGIVESTWSCRIDLNQEDSRWTGLLSWGVGHF
jgi:hypothetical protein